MKNKKNRFKYTNLGFLPAVSPYKIPPYLIEYDMPTVQQIYELLSNEKRR